MPWVILVLVVVALAAATTRSIRGAMAVSGDLAGLINIGGGRKLYLECKGAGTPGRHSRNRFAQPRRHLEREARRWRGGVSPSRRLHQALSAPNRPGTTRGLDQFSRSDPVPMPRTVADPVADLHALLGARELRRLTSSPVIRPEG